MLSQSVCNCPNKLEPTRIKTCRRASQHQDPLHTTLQPNLIKFLNPQTKMEEKRPVMEVLKETVETLYFGADSENVQAIPLYSLPDKKVAQGLPQEVENRMNQIEASSLTSQEKEKEKKELKKWSSNAVAHTSEDDVSNQIIKKAKEKNETCLVLSSYKSETYICNVREKAKAMRSSPAQPLNPAERDVEKILKMDLDITQELTNIMAELPNQQLSSSDLEHNNGFKKAVKTIQCQKKFIDSLKTVFRNSQAPLDMQSVENVLKYSMYATQVERASVEVDHLTIFPHRKVILQVETKSVMENPLGKLKEGAGQCHKFCKLFEKCHADVIMSDYTFIKVVAVPMLDTQAKLVAKPGSNTQPPCSSCKTYIWTQEELGKVDEWMEANILTGAVGQNTPEDYKDLFTRLIGFLSISSLSGQYFHSEEDMTTAFDEAIVGEDVGGVTAEGLSPEDQATEFTQEKLEKIKIFDIKGKGLSHIETFLLWNSDQLTLILQNPDRVCLPSDYGTGKSLLAKFMAKKKAAELIQSGSSDKVVFVSFGSADKCKYSSDWEQDTIYDIATRMEFQNSGVEFYSTGDLINKFTTPEERNDSLTLEVLMERIIAANPSYSFFFDEVCVGSFGDFFFPHLQKTWSVATGSIWIAIRPSFVLSSHQSQYDQQFAAFKTDLENNQVHFPVLAKSMRNTANILKVANTAERSSLNPTATSILPLNTVTGPIPRLVIADSGDDISTTGVHRAIQSYTSNEPLVILGDSSSRVDEIGRSCSGAGHACIIYNPGENLTDTKEDVENFLQRPQGILITSMHLFNGCQAKHVISCVYADRGTRGGVMRGRVTSVIVTSSANFLIGELKKVCEIVSN